MSHRCPMGHVGCYSEACSEEAGIQAAQRPGAVLHGTMTEERYNALPGLRWSRLKLLRESPLHYRRPPDDFNRSMELGLALHAIRGDVRVVAYPGAVRRGREWEQFQVQHQGELIVTKKEREDAMAMADALRSHTEARSMLEMATAVEQAITWSGGKCRIDAMTEPGLHGPMMLDLKSTKSLKPRVWGSDVAQRGYVHQLAWYRRGYRAVRGDNPPLVLLVAVENKPPFDVRVDEIPDALLDQADRDIDALLERLAQCEESGLWPGRAPDRCSIADVLPEWWSAAETPDFGDL